MQGLNGLGRLLHVGRFASGFAGPSPTNTPTSMPSASMPTPFIPGTTMDLGFLPDPRNDVRCARKRLEREMAWDRCAMKTGVAVAIGTIAFVLIIRAATHKNQRKPD